MTLYLRWFTENKLPICQWSKAGRNPAIYIQICMLQQSNCHWNDGNTNSRYIRAPWARTVADRGHYFLIWCCKNATLQLWFGASAVIPMMMCLFCFWDACLFLVFTIHVSKSYPVRNHGRVIFAVAGELESQRDKCVYSWSICPLQTKWNSGFDSSPSLCVNHLYLISLH